MISDIKDAIESLVSSIYLCSDYAVLPLNDSNLTSALKISYDGKCGKDSISAVDAYLTDTKRVQVGKIRIYDMTRTQYNALDEYPGCVSSIVKSDVIETNDCLGIVPVIVTPVNAMYF